MTSNYLSLTTVTISYPLKVRQGKMLLSSVLFALYLNDLENLMHDKNVHGLDSISDDIENELNMYLKLLCPCQ